jgi:hypothetical protein
LADTVQKLHLINKSRHETEIKLAEEIEKTRSLNEVGKVKDEVHQRKIADSEEVEKRCLDLQRAMEILETKKQGIERQFELTKK